MPPLSLPDLTELLGQVPLLRAAQYLSGAPLFSKSLAAREFIRLYFAFSRGFDDSHLRYFGYAPSGDLLHLVQALEC